MSRKFKASIFSLFFLFATVSVAAQGSAPQPPHEVYGTVTDNGVQAQGVTVEAVSGGEVIVSDTTDSNGYYELKVPYNYSSFDLVVAGSTERQGVSVVSGEVQEVDFSGDYITGNGLSVSVPDEAVDEGGSVEISPSVSKEGSNPSYSWSIVGDDHGAVLTGEDERTVTFEAPSDVGGDIEVVVRLTVEKAGGSSKSDTGTVTVIDTGEKSGGSGAGTGSGQKNQSSEPKQVEARLENGESTAVIEEVKEGQQVQVTVPETPDRNGTNPIEEVTFTSSEDVESVSVKVKDLGSRRPQQVSELPGDVYSYHEVSVEGITDEQVSSATIRFRVDKSFLSKRGRGPEDVVMKRYSDNLWKSLDTEITEELDNAYRFEASSEGFSYYAIALENRQQEDQIKQNQTDRHPGNQTGGQDRKPSTSKGMGKVLVLLILLVLLVAGAAAYRYREEIEEKMTGVDQEGDGSRDFSP